MDLILKLFLLRKVLAGYVNDARDSEKQCKCKRKLGNAIQTPPFSISPLCSILSEVILFSTSCIDIPFFTTTINIILGLPLPFLIPST